MPLTLYRAKFGCSCVVTRVAYYSHTEFHKYTMSCAAWRRLTVNFLTDCYCIRTLLVADDSLVIVFQIVYIVWCIWWFMATSAAVDSWRYVYVNNHVGLI